MKKTGGGKFNGALLTKMRDAVFSRKAKSNVNGILLHAECMRDDQALLDKAQEKRERKAARNVALRP